MRMPVSAVDNGPSTCTDLASEPVDSRVPPAAGL
jgi:hypothetical protein